MQVPAIPAKQVLNELKSICKDVQLFIDMLFVDGIPFLHSALQKIGSRTAEVSPDQGIDSIPNRLHNIIEMHAHNGFIIKPINASLEFKPIESHIAVDGKRISANILNADNKKPSC